MNLTDEEERYKRDVGLFVTVDYETPTDKVFYAKGVLTDVDDGFLFIDHNQKHKHWKIKITQVVGYRAFPVRDKNKDEM